MTVSYDTLLRDKLGGTTVGDELWRAVTSVEAGDERAYGEALLTIDRLSWRDFEDRYYETVSCRWANRMVGDSLLPGGALETLFSAGRVHNKFRAALAAHLRPHGVPMFHPVLRAPSPTKGAGGTQWLA